VFCREQVEWTEPLVTEAQKAVNALGLDFGAVDIIYNGHEDKYYVLEVNTAPGMEGETMFSYVCSFLNIMEAL
jgi:D-alanine-D-alanine ligase-like ATP-grasp enzyme